MKGKAQTVDEAIRIEAYLLSEKAGHPAGMEAYFWEQAQVIVQARTTAVAVAVKKATAKKPSVAKAKLKATPAKAKPAAVKKESKPKAAAKATQLSLDGSAPASPARKRPAKK